MSNEVKSMVALTALLADLVGGEEHTDVRITTEDIMNGLESNDTIKIDKIEDGIVLSIHIDPQIQKMRKLAFITFDRIGAGYDVMQTILLKRYLEQHSVEYAVVSKEYANNLPKKGLYKMVRQDKNGLLLQFEAKKEA